MRRAAGAPWGRKPAHERWSTRRCGSTRHRPRPSICGPRAQHRADIYRSESIHVGPRKRGVIFPGRVPESMALKIRRRSRLRRKEATDFLGRLADEFGMAVPLDDVPLDEAEAGPHRLLLRGNDAIAIFLEGGIAPTIRGLLVFPAKKRSVTVDMGAVRFIYNGADVMAPGIVDADPGIRAGDIVWVRDEKNGRPLAMDGRSWTDPRWPARRKARRSRRSTTWATRSGGSARRSLEVARLRAVLFDIDGTLLDTRDAWVAAFDAGLAAIRKTSLPGSEAAQWIGTPIEVIYAERCGLSGDELAKAVIKFQRVEAESVHDGMRAYPGVREALASLAAWELATVSNKRRDTSVEALRATGLLPFFALVLGGDSVPRKKPAPDPILKAASALGVHPTECAIVGDTEVDVRAGKAAGARTVGVTWGYGTRARLEDAGVDYLIETPDALPALLRALTPSTAA